MTVVVMLADRRWAWRTGSVARSGTPHEQGRAAGHRRHGPSPDPSLPPALRPRRDGCTPKSLICGMAFGWRERFVGARLQRLGRNSARNGQATACQFVMDLPGIWAIIVAGRSHVA